jgi:hypothetical protein
MTRMIDDLKTEIRILQAKAFKPRIMIAVISFRAVRAGSEAS